MLRYRFIIVKEMSLCPATKNQGVGGVAAYSRKRMWGGGAQEGNMRPLIHGWGP